MAVEFRYRRLGYVALNVTDIDRSMRFYTDMVGLQRGGKNGDECLLRCTARHHDVILKSGDVAGLSRVGWEMATARDVALVRSHFTDLGLRSVDVDEDECKALGIQEAFRVTEPLTGATFEYYHSMSQALTPFETSVTQFARLGHVVIGTPKFDEAENHFTEQLNFRVSDRMHPAVFWMRCFPNPLHHSLALGRAETNRLNHINFMVTDIDDVGKAMWRLKKNDVPIVFGPGRHPPSESVFLYFLDPDKLTLEFSFGMEEFPEVGARAPRDLTLSPESIDYWGAVPDPAFGATGAIEVMAS